MNRLNFQTLAEHRPQFDEHIRIAMVINPFDLIDPMTSPLPHDHFFLFLEHILCYVLYFYFLKLMYSESLNIVMYLQIHLFMSHMSWCLLVSLFKLITQFKRIHVYLEVCEV